MNDSYLARAATRLIVLAISLNVVDSAWTDEAIKLPNGIRVVLEPIEGVEQVAIEAIYEVGIIHEPKGATQIAHLLEHVMCRGATDSFQAGETFEEANKLGAVNAETLAYWTHYDYLVPREKLQWALRVEADRMASLRCEQTIIDQEAPRCHREATFVEQAQNAQATMVKFAFMALNQSWQHGAETTRVHRGLEEISPAQLRQFFRHTYRPDRLTLVVVGGFDVAEARRWIDMHFRPLAARDETPLESPSWDRLPQRATMTWDSKASAVCLAYPPPRDAALQAALTFWAPLVAERINADPKIQALAKPVFANTLGWQVGPLPFFIYAETKDGADINKLEEVLVAKLDALTKGPLDPTDHQRITMQVRFASAGPRLTGPVLEQQGKVLRTRFKVDQIRAERMVLGNYTLQLGLRQMAPWPRPGDISKRLGQVIRRTVDPANRLVVRLVPHER